MSTMAVPGITQPVTVQWLNPDAFVSAVDPSTGACINSSQTCQFGNLGRNAVAPILFGMISTLRNGFPMTERVRIRFDAQFFNVFNHPNFGLPSMVLAGIPGKPSTQNGFGALTYHDVASHWSIGSRPGRRQQSTHDRVSNCGWNSSGEHLRDRNPLDGSIPTRSWFNLGNYHFVSFATSVLEYLPTSIKPLVQTNFKHRRCRSSDRRRATRHVIGYRKNF